MNSVDQESLCRPTHSTQRCCGLAFMLNYKLWPSRWAERGGSNTCRAAAEGKADICSFSVARPSCFIRQYGSKSELTQNNILTTATQTPSQASPWYLQTSLHFSFWHRSYFKISLCVGGAGKKARLGSNSSRLSPSIDQWHLDLHPGTWVSLWRCFLLQLLLVTYPQQRNINAVDKLYPHFQISIL